MKMKIPATMVLVFAVVTLIYTHDALSAACPQWPDQATKMLTKGDLANCDCGQLEILRNEVFARHGRKFKRSDLQNYFESQPWYRYDPNNPDGNKGLNKYEKANIATISNYEKSHGCVAPKNAPKPDSTYSCESIDGISLNQPASAVVNKYGKPSRTKRFEEDPDLDCSVNENYYYDNIGMMFNMCKGRVLEIVIESNSKARTSKNIGIGSSKADVTRAYKVDEWSADIIDPTQYGADTTLASSDCPITILFYLKNGKVVRIVWTGYP